MKEKFGPGAHITPAKTYGAGLERSPEADGFAPKKSDKKNNFAKVAIGATIAAVTVLLMKTTGAAIAENRGKKTCANMQKMRHPASPES